MAKGGAAGKLGKLKCMIKRWQAAAGNNSRLHQSQSHSSSQSLLQHHSRADDGNIPRGLHPVYVGKSRRRYLVSSHLLDHPLFRVLIQRSSGDDDDDAGKSTTVVGCEVVLFEHLLWMLENADPQSESLDELVDFYCC